MTLNNPWLRIVGFALHLGVAGMTLMAASGKLFSADSEAVQALKAHHLGGMALVIGAGEAASAVLLLLRWTSPLGLLLTSAFWGGAICLHMSHGEAYLMQSGLLVATWLGGYLRGIVPVYR